MKKCSKCGQLKLLNYFSKDKNNKKDRKKSYCKLCQNKYNRQYKENNLERVREWDRKWQQKYRQTEKRKKYQSEWAKRYREKYPEYWRKLHRQKQKRWRDAWREHYRASCRKYYYYKKSNPRYYMDRCMSNLIKKALKKKKAGKSWKKLLSYTSDDLIMHLEKQFNENMSWDNYGSYWHIDHIIPKSWYVYEKPEDIGFKMCWGLENLQPLEKTENFKKSNLKHRPNG